MRSNNRQLDLNLTMELDDKSTDKLTLDELKDYLQSRLNYSLGFRGHVKKLSKPRKKLLQRKAAKRGRRKSTAVHRVPRMPQSSRLKRKPISKKKTTANSDRTIDTNRAFLTVSEVSRLLNVHDNTVRRWSDQGVLKTYLLGPTNRRRFKLADVLGMIKEEPSQLQVDGTIITEHAKRAGPKS